MNKVNLQRMADHIRTVSQDQFDMDYYRMFEDETSAECNSVGCVIGHCTILDVDNLVRYNDGTIDFGTWSENFTGLKITSSEWTWCFSSLWADVDNTPCGAASRIEYLIACGSVPANWLLQMDGTEGLCY
jgi:hypothetical protein